MTPFLYTVDGGCRQGPADLWCTYAAIRTLTWLGADWSGQSAAADQLRACQNPDGGYAWQRGLPSDVWATYYCTQALADMGLAPTRLGDLRAWLETTRDGGFAMTPGQHPDVWATYYACRSYTEILDAEIPDRASLRHWLAGLQRADGGLGWYPDGTESDVRACYYAAVAWRMAFGAQPPPWDATLLVQWIQDRQADEGGFRFSDESPQACLWATFRAVRALDALDARPRRVERCIEWIMARRVDGGAFVRWADYDQPDVWACFSAVGALHTLGVKVDDETAEFIRGCQLPAGGFTYRAPAEAADSLATSAALIAGKLSSADWLRAAHMPYEGGVMYMPGRGAELRCTLWALSALAAVGGQPLDADRIGGWLRLIQNSDGGFGLWHGRASDLVATACAVETAELLGPAATAMINVPAARQFVAACRQGDAFRTTPAGAVTASATAQGLRSLRLLGRSEQAAGLVPALDRFASAIGGFAAVPRGIPDLVSTYQVALTRQQFGLPTPGLDRFLERIRTPDGGYAWSPLLRRDGGPLAYCLGTALSAAAPLPRLNL